MTIYTRFADIPAAKLASLSTADRASLTYWMLVQSGTLPIAALPKGWDVQEVADALPLSAGKFGNTLKVYAGDPLVREYGRDTVKSLHSAARPISGVTDGVLDWCVENGFARREGDYLVLDGVLAKLNPNAPKAPSPVPAYASDVVSPVKVTEPSPAAPKPKPEPAPEVIPAPPRLDFTEKELRGIRIALELMAENQLPRPVEILPKGDSAVVDTARELAVLLDALGPVTKNVLRERVRARLRPYTAHGLEYAVKCAAFQLVGNPARGGEYTLIDPEQLGMSWAQVKGLSARRKPARALAGARGT